MKISLITATYNSAATLQATFDSVRQQIGEAFEYIVVDGGSTDDTVEIIRKNQDIITTWVSEKDKGIYDAINKGIEMASGEVIGLMHSDDEFAAADILTEIQAAFRSDIDAVYGDLQYVDRDNPKRIIRKWKSSEYVVGAFHKGWMPAHPTFYLRRELFEKYGSYDLSFRISADYELMLRMFVKHNIRTKYLPRIMVNMKVGGESNVSWANRWTANKEDARAWKKNKLRPRFYTRILKPLSKVLQYI